MRFIASHEQKQRGTFSFPIQLYYIDSLHPRYEMPFHWHMECELIYVLEGEFQVSLDGESIALQKGQSAFVAGGLIHGGTPKDCIYECIVFNMEHFLQTGATAFNTYSTLLGEGVYINRFFKSGSCAGKIIDALFREMEKERNGYEFNTVGLLWQFIGTVIQVGNFTMPSEKSLRGHNKAASMKNALRCIRDNYSSPLTLQQLASVAGLSPQYFCRAFYQITGRTPIDYLNYYRTECAAELLKSTTESVTDIALTCGFNDLSYFIRRFKKQKGISPAKFRKEK